MSFSETGFNKWRAFFWPIHRDETIKIVPMMMMLFFICFNYTILRNVKDTVVVTAQHSGAEVIPFIKVWALLPMAVLLTVIFSKLSNRFSQEKVFYIMITGFLIFFGLFTFVFYPLQDILHPNQLSDYLETVLPSGLKGLIAMFRNWTFTIFYVMSELWGSIILSVLFWGFANEITKITEARRFYGMLGVIASTSGSVAGLTANFITEGHNWEQSLNILVSAIICCGCITMVIFRWMNKKVLNNPNYKDLHQSNYDAKEGKQKLSIRESFSFLSNSKYLICIAAIVVSYNLVINLVEIVWKDQLRQVYSSPMAYNTYMNNMAVPVGIIATLASLFMPKLMSRFGWTRTALITPVIMLITSCGFFAFMLFRYDLTGPVLALTGTTPLVIAVFFGASQVCMSKACKFSVFDATKEMAFIPLGHECKLKGKAAIDGVGSRLGKSGGSIIHQTLLIFFTTVSSSAPYVAVIIIAVIAGWSVAVRSLGKQFKAIVGEKDREEIGELEVNLDSTATSTSLQKANS
ncbi:MAG: NTP/NDP exchange transporter [Parachlamydiaceae bacterium]|nr:NTP/NDP exchange transporter [Parachlamydiaceae bacterium]